MGKITLAIFCKLILLFIIFISSAAVATSVSLNYPEQGNNFTATNNITFNCSASDNNYIKNLSLYHNITGIFEINQTQYYGEFNNYSNTLFLCHFNNELNCYANGSGTPVGNTSLSFEAGKFNSGVLINNSDELVYSVDGNFDKNQGTIEFWMNPRNDISAGGYDGWIFLIGSDYDFNSIEIFVNTQEIDFKIIDYVGTEHIAVQDVSAWQADEWHHIAAVWDLDNPVSDDNHMELYIDGSNSGSDYSETEYYIHMEDMEPNMFIGSYSGELQAEAVIDELRISNIPRTASELSDSYQNGINNYSSVSETWVLYNIPDGSYIWNCLAYNNNSEGNWSNNYSFFVDASPPSLDDMAIAPNSTDDLDPSITVNLTINITDISAIDTVIMQWRETAGWTNVTMTNTSSLWNASFPVDDTGGVFYYRVFANDTYGHSAISDTQNLSAYWDYTWIRSPEDFGTVYGFVTSFDDVGILVINNTGDDTLAFSLSSNWPLPVRFNGTEGSYQLYIEKKKTASVNITAKFAGSASESDMTITITASHDTETACPNSTTTNVTMNSYSGGPYLEVAFVSYPVTIEQSSTVWLNASIKNIGNETANETQVRWSLPAGWSLVSGNLSYNITNLSSGSTAFENISVTTDPLVASAGLATVQINASIANISDAESVNIIVNCSSTDGECGAGCTYETDSDCTIPGGGGTTTISSVIKEFRIMATTLARLDLNRGQTREFEVNVSNIETGVIIENVYISISGYPSVHMKTSPEYIKEIKYNKTEQFITEITAPVYMKYNEYALNIFVQGTGKYGQKEKTISTNVTMVLVIHEALENDTINYLKDANKSVEELSEMNLSTSYVTDLLEKANYYFEMSEYDKVQEISKEIISIKESMLRAYGLIKEVGEKIGEAEYNGLKIPETEKMYVLANAAFSREDYNRAGERARNAILAYAIEAGGKINIIKFVYNNLLGITISAIILMLIAGFSYRRISLILTERNLKLVNRKTRIINKLMKELQIKHFEKASMSAMDYHKGVYNYEKGLAKLEKRKARLISKIVNMKNPSDVIKNFQREQKHIQKMMHDVQRKYFESGSISKLAYKKRMDELIDEKVEIDRNIEVAKRGSKNKAFNRVWSLLRKKLFIILLIALVNPVAANAIGNTTDALASIERAENNITQMKELGFGITYANDTLNEAKLLFSQDNYLGAKTLADYVETIKEKALELDRLIDETEIRIYTVSSMGIETHDATELFNAGLSAFETEDYVTAEELIRGAFNKAEELESEAAMGLALEKSKGFDMVQFVRELWWAIIIFVPAVIITGLSVYRRIEIRSIKIRLNNLKEERIYITNLKKTVQKNFFQYNRIKKTEYDIAMKNYNKRLNEINKGIPLFRKRLEDITSWNLFRRR